MAKAKRLMPDDFKKKAEAIIDRIAKAKDELWDLIDEYRQIAEDSDEALNCFESGLQTLSQRV